MKEAINKVPAYNVTKKTMGKNSKMYILISWKGGNWVELPDTPSLHSFVISETKKANRMMEEGRVLKLKLAFGHAQEGDKIGGMDDEYFSSPAVLFFSKEDGGTGGNAPARILTNREKRDRSYNDTVAINQFLDRMYKSVGSPLYHGFLKEHLDVFTRILTMSRQYIQDTDQRSRVEEIIKSNDRMFSEEESQIFLLRPFMDGPYRNNVPSGESPERERSFLLLTIP